MFHRSLGGSGPRVQGFFRVWGFLGFRGLEFRGLGVQVLGVLGFGGFRV